MGFRSVFKVLQDVFPQVDSRVLKAVAIEHNKDADAAVEVVLVEVIPYLSKRSTAPSASIGAETLLKSSEAVVDVNSTAWTNDALAESACSDEPVNDSSFYDANGENDQVFGDNGDGELISINNCDERSIKTGPDLSSHVTLSTLIHENDANDEHDQIGGNSECEEIIPLGKYQKSSANVVGSDQCTHVSSTTFKHEDTDANGSTNSHLHADWEDLKPADCNINIAIHCESHQGQSCIDGNPSDVKNSVVQWAPSHLQECTQNATESSLQFVVVPDTLITDVKKPESSSSNDAVLEKDISTCETVDVEDDSTMNTVVTRSGQICSIDLLEDVIEEARSNKKTLLSAMDSVISLMKEVELQEKAAEQAKEEAARGGLDILARVEDLKQMLRHAKEANDMHAGEVYGEKAILATEARELQSRLLNLSDERDKSLAILDEMRQTLEVRLTAAEKEMKAAEQEKLEKEDSAQEALVGQQLCMEKVVQESDRLKQEAEENSKLREFFMDRGRVVDMLQGELSVKYQDVKSLKEKFDERVPLGKSLSSSQTSSFLASSSSSLKSVAPDQVPELVDSSKTLKKTSSTPSIDEPPSSGEERAQDDCKALVDEGWEFFDNREFYM